MGPPTGGYSSWSGGGTYCGLGSESEGKCCESDGGGGWIWGKLDWGGDWGATVGGDEGFTLSSAVIVYFWQYLWDMRDIV